MTGNTAAMPGNTAAKPETPAALTDGGPDSWIDVGASRVYGLPVDHETRCVHWSGQSDVIAIGFSCCGRLYPCRDCHDDVAQHPAQLWSLAEEQERVILCGSCTGLLSIAEYQSVDACPRCGAGFNPGCRLHHHLYFGWPAGQKCGPHLT